jgi:Family of unknown function (DUF5947)
MSRGTPPPVARRSECRRVAVIGLQRNAGEAMPITAGAPSGNWVAKLHRFVREPLAAPPEHCELCAVTIPPEHSHLAEPASRRLLCVCRACAMLLGNAQEGRYKLVPEQPRLLTDFHISDTEWEAFGIPIGLAFFFHSTAEGHIVAFYPGPAGSTESLLDLGAWSQLAARNPVLAELEPDVEALLVNRVKGTRAYYRMPIDRCYGLVGLIRTHWRGVSGGAEAWNAIDSFFAGLHEHQGGMGGRYHG